MRLSVEQVRILERLLGGDPVTEEAVLRFAATRYAAKSLFYLPPNVAAEIVRRPSDFLRAARTLCVPDSF